MPTSLPDIDPVVLLPFAKPFDGSEWIFEPKYDGFRGLLYSSATGCEIRSTPGHRGERFADLRRRLADVLAGREAILDGQIVALDRSGKPAFRDLLHGRGRLAFAAFDLLWLDGADLRAVPLADRKQRLAALLPADTAPLYKVFTLQEHGHALHEAARRLELEGTVAKRTADGYGTETIWYVVRNPAYRQPEMAQPERARWRTRVSSPTPGPDA